MPLHQSSGRYRVEAHGGLRRMGDKLRHVLLVLRR